MLAASDEERQPEKRAETGNERHERRGAARREDRAGPGERDDRPGPEEVGLRGRDVAEVGGKPREVARVGAVVAARRTEEGGDAVGEPRRVRGGAAHDEVDAG